jgi:hypothetical protein
MILDSAANYVINSQKHKIHNESSSNWFRN